MNSAVEAVAKIAEGVDLYVRSLRRPAASYPSNRASDLGHPCTRYLVLTRTQGEDAEPPSPTLQMLFNEGNLHERDLVRWLADFCDIHVTGSQTSFPPNSYNITGHVDGLLGVVGDGHLLDPDDLMVVEMKSLNGSHYPQINTAADMRNTSVWFIRKWYVQIQIYMFLSDRELAIVAIKNKWTGERKGIAVDIDYEYVEGLLERVEAINRHVRKNTLPDYTTDRSVCKRCPFFGRVCDPPMEGEGLLVSTDQLAIERIGRAKELSYAGGEFNALMGWIKDWAKSTAPRDEGEHVIAVGDHFVRVKNTESTRGLRQSVTVD